MAVQWINTWEMPSWLSGVAPLPDEAHALNAVRAAIGMQLAINQMNDDLFSSQKIHIRLSIGINTGSMVVGNLGSTQRHAYTVMGAVVNTASAIQQLTRDYQHDILIGAETAGRLPAEMVVDLGFAGTKKLHHKIKVFAVSTGVIE